MSESEANLENLSTAFDKLNDVREKSLTISREIVRECSKSIRNVHRNDISDAEKHIKSAQEKLNDLKSICSEISEISYAGYVLDAEREFVEAVMFTILKLKEQLNHFPNSTYILLATYKE